MYTYTSIQYNGVTKKFFCFGYHSFIIALLSFYCHVCNCSLCAISYNGVTYAFMQKLTKDDQREAKVSSSKKKKPRFKEVEYLCN